MHEHRWTMRDLTFGPTSDGRYLFKRRTLPFTSPNVGSEELKRSMKFLKAAE